MLVRRLQAEETSESGKSRLKPVHQRRISSILSSALDFDAPDPVSTALDFDALDTDASPRLILTDPD